MGQSRVHNVFNEIAIFPLSFCRPVSRSNNFFSPIIIFTYKELPFS